MLGSFPRPPLRAHTGDPNGHSQVSSARGAPHLPIDQQRVNVNRSGRLQMAMACYTVLNVQKSCALSA